MSGQFVKYDLGHLNGGELVTVTIRERANVRLFDSSNLRLYERGQRFHFTGGQALRSPVQLRVPSAGNWHVVLDLGGASGTIHANVTVST
jgi:Domain of unknown function (DUF1883)